MNDLTNADVSLALTSVSRSYQQGRAKLEVFINASLSLRSGEIVALVGPSGAGKSSLLHIAGLLETPDSGIVEFAGTNTNRLSDRARARIRRTQIGFVYQFHHLLPEFTARENVMVPQMIAGAGRAEAAERADALLSHLGLTERLTHRPGELSGGEQQRVAIARAIANRPRVLLADEPTGNLDPRTAQLVFDELLALARAEGLSALIATHNMELAKRMDRALRLQAGRIEEMSTATA